MQKHKYAIPTNLIILLLIILFGIQTVFAQNVAQNIRQINDTRVLVYFDKLPRQFNSGLSSDKKQIQIKIPGTNVRDSIRHKLLTGSFTDIYAQTFGDSLFLSLMLKVKSGYNSVRLPYSNAIMTECFQWSDLTPAQDHYRTALLGIEDSIIPGAKDELYTALRLGVPDAAYFLGMQFLKEGKINSAEIFLKKAAVSGCDIPDVFAALADIARKRNDYSSAAQNASMFEKKSGLKTIDFSIISQFTEDSTIVTEDTSALAALKVVDSSILTSKNIDSTNSGQNKILSVDSSAHQSVQPPSIPLWMEFGGYLFVGLLLLIIYFYLRWRNTKMKANLSARKEQFTNALEEQKANIKAQNKQALQKYKSNETTALKNEPASKQTQHNIKDETAKQVEEKNRQESIKSLLEESKRKTQSELMKKSLEIENETDPDDPTVKTPAKIELALHLAEEQQKIKSKQLEEISEKLSGLDQEKLIEAAKRIGIERGSLETKIALEKFLKDDKARNRLEEKFRQKEENENE